VSGVRDKIAKVIAGIRAYHSSPHDFDKFDLNKIGTGEGAQVYGHGLYFAENPAVSGQGGQYWKQFLGRFEGTPEGNAAKRLRDAGFDRDKAVADYEAFLQSHATKQRSPEAMASARRLYEAQMAKGVEELDLLRGGGPVGPRTYEVNIKADPAQFLDWDKPLGQQSDYVREAMLPQRLGLKPAGPLGDRGWYGWTDDQNRLIGRAQTKDVPSEIFDQRELGMSLYRGGGTWKPPEAATRLRDAGIPGIKYLDQGSRAAGTGSSNYVVFDPGIVDIVKKYGVVGAPAGMGALAAQDQYEVQP